jgi:hypothetical protein
MKFYFLIFLLLFTLDSIGQIDSKCLNNQIDYGDETQCDSIIKISRKGDLEYKLIFEQKKFDTNNRNLIVIPHTKTTIEDKSILFSNDKRLSKTILKIEYDTCEIRDFNETDDKRNFIEFVKNPDTTKITNWGIEINFQETHCMDTDYHSVKILKSESNYILFSCLHNINVFELDLNRDSHNELYLISYIWCTSRIRIYRINEKNAR